MTQVTSESSTDIIVIGSGAAGASAAIEAGRVGARIIGVEAALNFGGTAFVAGGGMCIPGTSLQRDSGVVDSPESALADLEAGGHDFDSHWAQLYLARANVDVFEWLTEQGVRLPYLKHFEDDSVPRVHSPLNAGAGMMGVLWERLGDLGLQSRWRFGWRFIDLIEDQGSIIGITCRDLENKIHHLYAKSVVVAIGGFAGSLKMIRRHARKLDIAPHVLAGGGVGASGDAIEIFEKHGVSVRYLEDLYCYATGVQDYNDPMGERGVVIRSRTGWIWLNKSGRRFHDESQTISGNVSVPRLLAQPLSTGWAIFDSAMLSEIEVRDHYVPPNSETCNQSALRHLAKSPWVTKANSLTELFGLIGIDVGTAKRTVQEWNEAIALGTKVDPLTSRNLESLKSITEGPFYAVRFVPIGRKGMGGVQTDLQCRARQVRGGILPGLYAAGEVAGMAGGHVAGIKPLEGMMVGPSIFSGRIAGREAARFAITGDGASVPVSY
jgi:predicted oxidoreductase